jgi:hypothetical protein
MKKKNILTALAILALLYFTKEQSAMHYDKATSAMTQIHQRATIG